MVVDVSNSGDPLNDLARKYKHDGDLMVCRKCGRGQQITWRQYAFPHRGDCKSGGAESRPWLLLAEAIAFAPLARGTP